MLNSPTASDSVIETIKEGAGVWSPAQLQALLQLGRRQRAPDYDSVCKGLVQRYLGDQAQLVKQALQAKYKKTYEYMPVDPVNWLRFFARQDSGVYQSGVTRSLVDDKKQPIDDEREEAFNTALDQIGVDSLMPELERRVNAGVRSGAVVVGYRQVEGGEKATAQLYWPQDVVTINHTSAPDDLDTIWFVALKQSTAQISDTSPVWWCWTREAIEDEMGNLLRFGPWEHRRVSEDGKIATASESYPGRLPIAFLRTELPQGGFWPAPDKDKILNVDSLNVSRSNRQHVVNSQAHATFIYKGKMREASELVGGPDGIIHIDTAEDLEAISANANHAAIEASATRDLQELGVAAGNSPDAYAVTPGEAQSGVSRMIANAPHDQRIAESKPIFKRFEEQQLLPILLNVLELFSKTAPVKFNATPIVQFANNQVFEDSSAKQQRILDLRTSNLIDDAEALVLLGMKDSREEALNFLESIKGIGRPVAGQFFSGAITTRETPQ